MGEMTLTNGADAGLVKKETAYAIAVAYQEIERGTKLLADVRKCMSERAERWPRTDEDLRDVFGHRHRDLQLGVPSGQGGHQICHLSYDLAVPIIEAHIANMTAKLRALSTLARVQTEAASRSGPMTEPTEPAPSTSA